MRSYGQLMMACLGLALAGGEGLAQFPATPEHNTLMEKKLVSAQEVMAAIAREDFDGISKQSQQLRLLSQEAAWNVLQTSEYIRLSEDFRNTTDQLQTAAKHENLDAVGLAFIKLSISCIDCHRHVKNELSRVGRIPLPASSLPLQR